MTRKSPSPRAAPRAARLSPAEVAGLRNVLRLYQPDALAAPKPAGRGGRAAKARPVPRYVVPSGVDSVELNRAYDLNDAATDYADVPAFDRDLLNNGYGDDPANFRLDYCSVDKSTLTGLSSISGAFVTSPSNWLLIHKPVDLDTYSLGSIWMLGKLNYNETNCSLYLGVARAQNVLDQPYNHNVGGSVLHIELSQYTSTQGKVTGVSQLVADNDRVNTALNIVYTLSKHVGVLVNFTKDGSDNVSAQIKVLTATSADAGKTGNISSATTIYTVTKDLGSVSNGGRFYPFMGMQSSVAFDQHRMLLVRTKNNTHIGVT